MRIRMVQPGDFGAIAALVNPHIASSHVHFGTSPVAAAELRADWEQASARHAFIVAEHEGTVAGFARTSTWRTRPAYAWTAEVGIYVDPVHQRRGLARQLYGVLLGVARAQGYHVLVAGIALPNEASVRLHEALGFTRVGTFHEVGIKLGRAIDVGFWELVLAPTDGAPAPVQPPRLDPVTTGGG